VPIAVSLGDPAGVGPEIVLKAFREGTVARDFVVVGDLDVIEACSAALGLGVPIRTASTPADTRAGWINLIEVGAIRRADFTPGRVSRACGAAARSYVEAGVRLALQGSVEALVTLPVNKEAVRLSDPGFSGHTGFIAGLCAARGVTMLLYSPKLAVSHVSAHLSLRDAIEAVRPQRIGEVIDLTASFLSKLGAGARLAVAGLNPHAGEAGAFGSEDLDLIAPAVDAARARGIVVAGPVPPDTVFVRASRGEFDAVVCMYHDQGHIPMKLLDFEGAVNVTLGLPIVRTSVDHGTAFDIAWKGSASTKSYVAAVELARRLAARSA
jgi:4-phospho-D-threonate 3-dehydrogenase / 4-phospho-D-erythronate 3-dehydrogenase